jgi:hypothetical protein
MSSIELAYGLMIAGALLVVLGFVGLALRRNKEVQANQVVLPGDAHRGDSDRILRRGVILTPSKTQDPHHLESRNTAGELPKRRNIGTLAAFRHWRSKERERFYDAVVPL